jgi:formamidopyrimidine-DNA glycosylase
MHTMPELPEVETVRCGLEPVMVGARFVKVEQRRSDLRFPFPSDFPRRLTGRHVTSLARRAKYLIAHLDRGEALIMHLGMSGRFTIVPAGGATAMPGIFHHAAGGDAAHDHVVFHLSTGARVIYNDVRRFGFMALEAEATLAESPHLRGLGIEPTGNALSGPLFAELFEGRQAPLKAALLDQRLIAGLGNIYVCEALFRAGLSPRRKAGTLAGAGSHARQRAETLAGAIRDVIADAIAAGGSSLRDYQKADGTLGYFQHAFQVYDRADQPCLRPGCGGTVRRLVQNGRSTFHCPDCQR